MAEETKVEETTEQESPTVEENNLENEVSEEAQPETEEVKDAPEDRNWRAVREELEALKLENKKLKGEEPTPRYRSDLDNLLMTPEENVALSKEELKAELKFPELESRNAFSSAVYGEYRMALDQYNLAKTMGQRAKLPSAHEIAKRVKEEMDIAFGSVSKKAEAEGAKKAVQSKESKEATVEAEGRSDRGKVARETSELSELQKRTRQGDPVALSERLARLEH